MLSKFITRLSQTQNMTQVASRAFRPAPQMNKKPSIGDAVTILQSKVSSISQVVSTSNRSRTTNLLNTRLNRNPYLLNLCRTIWRNSVLWFQLVMVLPECSVWPRFRLERWWSSAAVSRVWPLTWKLIMLVLSSWVTIGKPSSSPLNQV